MIALIGLCYGIPAAVLYYKEREGIRQAHAQQARSYFEEAAITKRRIRQLRDQSRLPKPLEDYLRRKIERAKKFAFFHNRLSGWRVDPGASRPKGHQSR